MCLQLIVIPLLALAAVVAIAVWSLVVSLVVCSSSFVAAHILCTLLFLNYNSLKYECFLFCCCVCVVVVVVFGGGIQTGFLLLLLLVQILGIYAFDKQLNEQDGMAIRRSGLRVWQLVVILSKLFRDQCIFS